MKKQILILVLGVLFIYFNSTIAQEIKIIFKTTVKTAENIPIPRVYVKIYDSNTMLAVDSVFSDQSGYIEHELPFSFQANSSSISKNKELEGVIGEISPNIIHQDRCDYTLRYNNPHTAQLFFVDVQGKIYPNQSVLATGIYLYFLRFGDGTQSEFHKMIVTQPGPVRVDLISTNRNSAEISLKSDESWNVFYIDYIKDGYITHRDTIEMDSTIITSACQLFPAKVPVADFSVSGTLQVGGVVLFDGSASYGAMGEELVYSWDFGNGNKGQSVDIPHIYTRPGDYNVTLTVAGSYGAKHSLTKSVNILPGPVSEGETGVVKGYVVSPGKEGISNATIHCIEAEKYALTNDTGYVELTGLPIGIPLHLKITKNGFVTQVVSLTIPVSTEEAIFYNTLKSRNAVLTISDVEYGGKLDGTDGTKVILPFDGLIRSDGSVATGDVSVTITPVDVVFETSSFPGSFQGIKTDGEDGVLLSYGVSEFNFSKGAEELQLAPGKVATIIVPVYTSGLETGDEVPLWSVNEDNGIWVQEGTGVIIESESSPTGLAMMAEVCHFSWWNCDDWDSEKKRNGLCWRWECTTAQCYKVKVGCWMSGAQREPDGSSERKMATHREVEDRDEIPPVFEVREFVSEEGMDLIFPGTRDVYVEARAFGENGKIYSGNYTVYATELSDSFEIELIEVEPSDTSNASEFMMNTRQEFYLEPDQIYRFNIQNSKDNLLRFWINRGSEPYLPNAVFTIEDENGIIETGNFHTNAKFIPVKEGELTITIAGVNSTDEGNFYIELFEPERLFTNDSITDSLTVVQKFRYYRIDSAQNAIVLSRFYKDASASGYGQVKLLSKEGVTLKTAYLNNTETYINSMVGEKNPGYLEITSNSLFDYTFITSTETNTEIAYGDTVYHSLDFNQDINLYRFSGLQNDFVVIKGIPDYGINGGIVELRDSCGNVLVTRSIKYYHYYQVENEIDFKLPANGDYYIMVYSTQNETGTYTLLMNKYNPDVIPYNNQTSYSILPDEEHYFRVDIPDGKYTHLSLLSDVSSGKFDLITSQSEILTTNITNQAYTSYYYGSYSDTLEGGEYYIKVENDDATEIYINIYEAMPLEFDSKGKCQLTDTISHIHGTNVYRFTGAYGDGVHGIFRKIDGTPVPEDIELVYIPLHKKSDMLYPQRQKLNSYSLDSTVLQESGVMLNETETVCTWILIAHAATEGIYDFTFHHIPSSDSLVVDDDYAQYPEANTSSLVAAGYAVSEGGDIFLAEGVYSSYLTVTVSSANVNLTGQDKDMVFIRGMYNYSGTPALSFNSQGGRLGNVTVSTGPESYESLYLYGNNSIAENIIIEPLPARATVSGRLKARGDNTQLRNITIHNALYGISTGGKNCSVEDCSIQSKYTAVEGGGDLITVRHNTIIVEQDGRAIYIESGLGYGNHTVDSNQITMNFASSYGSGGIIHVQENGNSADTNTSYIRNNNILSTGNNYAISAIVGNPPSKIIVENNRYNCIYASGGRALYMQPGRTDGGSTVIVRNNIFEGLTSWEDINISNVDYISDGYKFVLLNNSFRVAAGAVQNTSYGFIHLQAAYSTYIDTASVYLVNNVFEGNGFSYWVNFSTNFSIYSNYNVVYNYSTYKGINGTLIGTTEDKTTDPEYTGDDLHVSETSPANNNGASPAQFEDIPVVDIEGRIRPQGSGYDIGAYETN